jgi:hypothetical protein
MGFTVGALLLYLNDNLDEMKVLGRNKAVWYLINYWMQGSGIAQNSAMMTSGVRQQLGLAS